MFAEWYIIIAVACSIITSHIIKEALHIWKNKEWDWYVLLMQTGGMPSSHAAGVTSLSMAIFLQEGMTTAFWVALVLAVVVIRDAFGVRKSVSDQAKLLNILSSKAKLEKKVKIVLGHTPVQTAAGVFLGLLVAIVTGYWFGVV